MQKKIRTWTKQKVPFLLIAGDDDANAGTVSFRYRDGSQRNGIPLDQAAEEVLSTIRSRVNAGPSAALFDEAEAAGPDAGAGAAVEGAAAAQAAAERRAVERAAAGTSGKGTAPA
jgi:Anticodon binding domain